MCALGRIRTCDTRFRRAVLYPLSYEGADRARKCEKPRFATEFAPASQWSTMPVPPGGDDQAWSV